MYIRLRLYLVLAYLFSLSDTFVGKYAKAKEKERKLKQKHSLLIYTKKKNKLSGNQGNRRKLAVRLWTKIFFMFLAFQSTHPALHRLYRNRTGELLCQLNNVTILGKDPFFLVSCIVLQLLCLCVTCRF